MGTSTRRLVLLAGVLTAWLVGSGLENPSPPAPSAGTSAGQAMMALPVASGPHGGTVFQDGRNAYELARDGGGVNLYSLNAYEPLPRTMTITLYRDPLSVETLELAAVTPVYEPYARFAPMPSSPAVEQGFDTSQNAGRVAASNESYLGVELRFGAETFPRKLTPVG